ncbi:MAG: TonB-dependent receptor [Aridibacter famidurans]|nr:TonB-dependent receptor [Aridibacter famidurans]
MQFGKLSLLATLFLTTITAGFGQDLDEVTIKGAVRDILGGAVAGARVTAVNEITGIRRTSVTDANGRFILIELEPGDYRIEAEAAGFAQTEAAVRGVLSGETLSIYLEVTPDEVSASVTVSSESDESPDVSRTVPGDSLKGELIDRLPVPSEDVLDLLLAMSGTDEEPFSIDGLADDDRIGNGSEFDRPSEVTGAGSISLNGGAAYSTNITIDGMDNNDDRQADERFQPPPGSVAEVQVVANQFSAEYGRASGGRINIRTRSGEAGLRGNLHASFEDASLNANTYNNNRRGLTRLPFTRIDPGVTLLGTLPGSTGRTRFLGSFLFQNRISSSLIDTMVPVDRSPFFDVPPPTHSHEARVDDIPNPQSDTFPLVYIAPYRKSVPTPGYRSRSLVRIDQTISDRHSLSVNYQLARSRDLRQYRETTRYLEETLQARLRSGDALQISDSFALSDNVFNQIRFQFSDHRPGFAAEGAGDPVVLLFISDDGRAGSDDQVRGTIVAGNSTANFANLRSERRFQVQESLTIAAGSHTVRVGADIQTLRSRIEDLADSTGTFNFSRVYDLIAGQPSRYRRSFGNTSVKRNTYLGIFFQDDLQVRPGLTVSAGIRYERESILRDDNNFGPRVAIAWSPGDDGKTVIRAGAGIFYNRVLLRTLDDYALGKQERRFDSEALSGPSSETRCLNQVEPGPNAQTDKCRFLSALAAGMPSAPDEGELVRMLSELGIEDGGFVTDTNFTRFVEKGIRIPESYQFNAGIERDLGGGFVTEASFTFNKASGLWRETNVNAFRPPPGFATLTEYLLSLGTFDLGGRVTRFELGDPGDAGGVSDQAGIRIVNLASSNPSEAASAPIGIAFAALEATLVRPFDPELGQVEMVSSIGRSVYEGLTISVRRGSRPLPGGFSASFRAAYTLSRTRDDGFVDTSSAQTPGDFRAEFSASSIDRRHRFRFYGTVDFPRRLGGFSFSPVIRIESARPFNLGIGGTDRNLDDVSNDRPSFRGDVSSIISRDPGDPFPDALARSFALAPIGTPGDLPRNAGRGPSLFVFNAAVARKFRFGERASVTPQLTVTNVLNATVFSFGSDFINLSESGSSEFRQGFLVPSRTLAQRKIRLGLRIDF